MKRFLIAAAVVAATFSTPALAADVGISISIGDPNYYGRIDIGGYPQPRLLYSQPRVMYRDSMYRQPIYMRVPPGHAKNWRKHCRKYNACQERVYFVQDNWYSHEYAPRYREQSRHRRDDWRDDHRRDDHRRDDGRGDHRNDPRNHDSNDTRGGWSGDRR
jgi:Uncharacterized protein probably involved in high-affinity Fe2+ transport